MNISINIPSYKRPIVETLKYLKNGKVWVCESEYDSYLKANKNINLIKVPLGIQGNVCRIRNYILKTEFENGMDAVCIIDDDMNGIYNFERVGNYGYKKKKLSESELNEWLEVNTNLCIELGYKLWGIALLGDPKAYLQHTPINLNKIILGPFSVHIKNNDLWYDENLPLKEDYDLSLQHLKKYNGILRLNSFHYICKQSENVGGCASYRNYEKERTQFELLRKKWGSKIIRKDNGSKKEFDYNPIIKVPIKGV